MPTKRNNLASVKELFRDIPQAKVFSLGQERPEDVQVFLSRIGVLMGMDLLALGFYGSGFLEEPEEFRFDEDFYRQAQVSFSERVEGTKFPRNFELEKRLEETLGIDEHPFVFVHDDPKRGMNVRQELLPSGIKIIRSTDSRVLFPITAWVGILHRASEIHVIESSFAALVESIDPKGRKVAHRYARQLVIDRPEMEFSYQTEWEIYR